ncbi:hypothetical protein BDV96DRAFT_677941 [Lophiotrema nucula]|uniref:Uncharacterized protein n=1 Tax=Lophiotrema nucula TaxID=690887 RepID=A0A6A5ZIK6_9PLEO|nr:hypothetical protein BDV96DRAFT_677941 [Lophiotrema nucula]
MADLQLPPLPSGTPEDPHLQARAALVAVVSHFLRVPVKFNAPKASADVPKVQPMVINQVPSQLEEVTITETFSIQLPTTHWGAAPTVPAYAVEYTATQCAGQGIFDSEPVVTEKPDTLTTTYNNNFNEDQQSSNIMNMLNAASNLTGSALSSTADFFNDLRALPVSLPIYTMSFAPSPVLDGYGTDFSFVMNKLSAFPKPIKNVMSSIMSVLSAGWKWTIHPFIATATLLTMFLDITRDELHYWVQLAIILFISLDFCELCKVATRLKKKLFDDDDLKATIKAELRKEMNRNLKSKTEKKLKKNLKMKVRAKANWRKIEVDNEASQRKFKTEMEASQRKMQSETQAYQRSLKSEMEASQQNTKDEMEANQRKMKGEIIVIITEHVDTELKPSLAKQIEADLTSKMTGMVEVTVAPMIVKQVEAELAAKIMKGVTKNLKPKISQDIENGLEPKIKKYITEGLEVLEVSLTAKITKDVEVKLAPKIKKGAETEPTAKITKRVETELKRQVMEKFEADLAPKIKHELKQAMEDELLQTVRAKGVAAAVNEVAKDISSKEVEKQLQAFHTEMIDKGCAVFRDHEKMTANEIEKLESHFEEVANRFKSTTDDCQDFMGKTTQFLGHLKPMFEEWQVTAANRKYANNQLTGFLAALYDPNVDLQKWYNEAVSALPATEGQDAIFEIKFVKLFMGLWVLQLAHNGDIANLNTLTKNHSENISELQGSVREHSLTILHQKSNIAFLIQKVTSGLGTPTMNTSMMANGSPQQPIGYDRGRRAPGHYSDNPNLPPGFGAQFQSDRTPDFGPIGGKR